MKGAHDLFLSNVLKLLAELGWNQARLAKESKITSGNLSKYLGKKKLPSLVVVDRIARALKTTPSRILAEQSEIHEHDLTECLRRVEDAVAKAQRGPTVEEFFDVLAELVGDDADDRAKLERLVSDFEALLSNKKTG